MIHHSPSGLPLLEAGEIHDCPGGAKMELVPLTTTERMKLRIGRYLLKRCATCKQRYLIERDNS